jgi:hypothetical protein
VSGKPLSTEGVNRYIVKKWFSALNIRTKNASSHSLRKTFARNFFDNNGKDLEALVVLSKYLCHKDISTTLCYIGVEAEKIRSGAKNISYGDSLEDWMEANKEVLAKCVRVARKVTENSEDLFYNTWETIKEFTGKDDKEVVRYAIRYERSTESA